jgi:hypothetical protein
LSAPLTLQNVPNNLLRGFCLQGVPMAPVTSTSFRSFRAVEDAVVISVVIR